MAKRQSGDLRQWAVIGAEQRLLQIAEEAAMIFRTFPELRGRGFMARDGAAAGRAGASGEQDGRREATQSRGRGARRATRQLSPEARKRISDAQKARWAKQKAGGERQARARK